MRLRFSNVFWLTLCGLVVLLFIVLLSRESRPESRSGLTKRVTWQFFNWNPVPRYVPTDWPVVFVSVHFLVMLKIVVCMIFRDISYNQISGEIPYNIGFLQVATLSLQGNSLTVKIPEVIGLMQALAVLDLSENELVGPIPQILGNLSYIGKLYLHGNKLTGPIPPELGNMSKLSYLQLNGNQLVGGIPAELGKLEQLFGLRPTHGEVEGVEGIMAAYASALRNVALAGPTLFGQVINTAAEIAGRSLSQGSNKYFALLIITDGVLTDLQETKDALVMASDLPLSILIVGVGGADFKQMEILDADNGHRL